MTVESEKLLSFWFGGDLETPSVVATRCRVWFQGDDGFDAEIRARFASLPDHALQGPLPGAAPEPRRALARVIALDQLPRNLYRGSARAFAYDTRAREAAEAALERGSDDALHPLEALFLYLPLEHAEDPAAQRRCVELCRALLERAPGATREHYERFVDYALRHQRVIERFGRFPHRNPALAREPTEAEHRYLAEGGDRF